MPNTKNLEELLNKIEAVNEAKTPNMPIGIYVQESEDLHYWAINDADELESAGLDLKLIDHVLVRAGALREAQSKVRTMLNLQGEFLDEWTEEAPAGYELRDDLLDDFRYAYRKNDDILGRVSEIAEGSGHADMVQDLNDLKVLGEDNPEQLKAIKLDTAKLEQAGEMSDKLAGILAKANGERIAANNDKIIRDKAYTYLKEAVDEIRDCGKYVFKKNPDRLKGYRSNFIRKLNFKKRN